MKTNRLVFELNSLFLAHENHDELWFQLYQRFKLMPAECGWPIILRPEHMIDELRSYVEHNDLYEVIRRDREIFEVVLQERLSHSMLTCALDPRLAVMMPKSSWFLQRSARCAQKFYRASNRWAPVEIPLGRSFFVMPNSKGELVTWTNFLQSDGVGIVQRFDSLI